VRVAVPAAQGRTGDGELLSSTQEVSVLLREALSVLCEQLRLTRRNNKLLEEHCDMYRQTFFLRASHGAAEVVRPPTVATEAPLQAPVQAMRPAPAPGQGQAQQRVEQALGQAQMARARSRMASRVSFKDVEASSAASSSRSSLARSELFDPLSPEEVSEMQRQFLDLQESNFLDKAGISSGGAGLIAAAAAKLSAGGSRRVSGPESSEAAQGRTASTITVPSEFSGRRKSRTRLAPGLAGAGDALPPRRLTLFSQVGDSRRSTLAASGPSADE